jgi:hypothetical protein
MRFRLPFALLATVFACSMHAAPAQAQRVFVSATGSDGNPCTFASPCRSFQHAHDTAPANGEIDVLDPAGYGAVTITKAISIQGHGYSGISVASGATGITINAGPNDAVHLQGLLIDGAGVGQTGIAFKAGASLTIENSVIRNLTSSGIAISPSSFSVITVSSTLVANNGGHGIYVQPPSGGSVNAVFNRVEVYGNAQQGIGIFGNFDTTGLVRAAAIDCVAANNENGFFAQGNNVVANTILRVIRSTAFNNINGVNAIDSALIVVSHSNLEDNNSPNWVQSSGGSVLSYGDNSTDGDARPGGLVNLQ